MGFLYKFEKGTLEVEDNIYTKIPPNDLSLGDQPITQNPSPNPEVADSNVDMDNKDVNEIQDNGVTVDILKSLVGAQRVITHIGDTPVQGSMTDSHIVVEGDSMIIFPDNRNFRPIVLQRSK